VKRPYAALAVKERTILSSHMPYSDRLWSRIVDYLSFALRPKKTSAARRAAIGLQH